MIDWTICFDIEEKINVSPVIIEKKKIKSFRVNSQNPYWINDNINMIHCLTFLQFNNRHVMSMSISFMLFGKESRKKLIILGYDYYASIATLKNISVNKAVVEKFFYEAVNTCKYMIYSLQKRNLTSTLKVSPQIKDFFKVMDKHINGNKDFLVYV